MAGRTAWAREGSSSHESHSEEHQKAHESHSGEHHAEHHGESGSHSDWHHPGHHDKPNPHPVEHPHTADHPWNPPHHPWDSHHPWDPHHGDFYHHEWWHHHATWHQHPWQHWWHHPTVNEVSNHFGGWGWKEPLYYDYGPQGNVAYRSGNVYVNGTLVGSDVDYRNSAIALAGSASPSQESADWLPLGSFALAKADDPTEPSQTLQLAVNKEGAISGVLFNLANDTAASVTGAVDRKTQRAAFFLDAQSGTVAETAIHNLTRDKASLLVHYRDGNTEHYTLHRLESPPIDSQKVSQASD
jgi:hypothetical protein